MKLLAFNNEPQLKADLMIELHKHRAADSIIKGTYGYSTDIIFRGCAVGCSLNSYNIVKGLTLDTSIHSNYEKFGIPQLLARLEDSIFEGLPETHNLDWPINFMSAISVGANLSTVWPKFAQWLMTDEKYGVLQYVETNVQKEFIQKISDLYKNGGSAAAHAAAAASAASNSASAAVYYANASAAAYYADVDDKRFEVRIAQSNAANAAHAAADAAADDAAYYADAAAKRFEVRIAQSEYLIQLLKECK